jgi:hypothetical protein
VDGNRTSSTESASVFTLILSSSFKYKNLIYTDNSRQFHNIKHLISTEQTVRILTYMTESVRPASWELATVSDFWYSSDLPTQYKVQLNMITKPTNTRECIEVSYITNTVFLPRFSHSCGRCITKGGYLSRLLKTLNQCKRVKYYVLTIHGLKYNLY